MGELLGAAAGLGKPQIWLVVAVGMSATSSELRTPYFLTSLRSASQSWRSPGPVCVGEGAHMSNWKTPCCIGLPSNDTCAPGQALRAAT